MKFTIFIMNTLTNFQTQKKLSFKSLDDKISPPPPQQDKVEKNTATYGVDNFEKYF